MLLQFMYYALKTNKIVLPYFLSMLMITFEPLQAL